MTDVDYCVVGAGFAGLTAALRLKQAGESVALLEARDRVGGRTFTEVSDDGVWIDRGGAWVGPGQDRIKALMNEFGVPSYKQYTDGKAMMVRRRQAVPLLGHHSADDEPVGGGQSRRCLPGVGPDVQVDPAGSAVGSQERREVGPDHAGEVAGRQHGCPSPRTICSRPPSPAVTPRPRRRFRCYSRSTRWRRAADRRFVLGVKDGSQDSRIVGGMGAVYAPMAAEIGDSLHLSQPVRRIDQDADGVTVRSDDMTVRARRVIVAVPIAIASQILYEPMLPVDRSFLHQRMPSGAIYKINIVYDEPFWRADGLSGQSAAPGSPATVTIDASTDARQSRRAVRDR